MVEVGAQNLSALQFRAFTDLLRLCVVPFAFPGAANAKLPILTSTGDTPVASTFVYSNQRNGTQGP